VLVAVAVALGAVCGPGAAVAAAPAARVSIGFATYAPAQISVLTGETVTWKNDSVRNHTVTADDGTYDSGTIVSQSLYVHRYDVPGTYTYTCTLHAGMRGEVDVADVLLDAPAGPAGPGRPFPLSGRAAADQGTPVALEADTGDGFHQVASTTVGSDGTFTGFVTPTTTATYRATVNGSSSPPVQLIVLDHTVSARPSAPARRVTVAATVAPASPGAGAVLLLRLRDRFGWWPVQRTRLDARSQARFTLRLGHRVPARVVLTLKDGATQLAASRIFHVGPQAATRAP
jgi:plastocyanin